MKKFTHIRHLAIAAFLTLGTVFQLTAQCQFTPHFSYAMNPNGGVDFIDLSDQANPGANAVSWQWDFGDGGTNVQQNPTHIYNAFGPYSVCLTVSFVGGGVQCQSTYCDSVVIGPMGNVEDCFNGIDDDGDLLIDQADPDCQVFGPCADFRAEFASSEIPAVPGVSFIDQSMFLNGNGVVTSWTWDFGDGGTSAQQNPVYLYTQPGNYYVCLTVTGDINGLICTQIYCAWVTFGQNMPCQADFDANALNSNTFEFNNLSTGGFTNLVWSFDDGFTSTDYSPTHAFQQIGNFNVCLSIWDSLNCQSFICENILVTAVDSTCYFTDCVFPGDANHDEVANMDDFLQIALGHGTQGLPRPNAILSWVGQSSPDWNTNINGINSKHADCDGNALIDSFDVEAIMLNYNHLHDGINPRTGNPPISLVFDQQVYNVGNGLTPTIGADIYAGDAQFPFTDVYGMAFTMEYPNGDIQPGTINVTYDYTSWLSHAVVGNTNIKAFKEIPDNNLTDAGFARTDHNNTNGYGKVGRVTFIVSDDLVERAAGLTPLPITISGTRGVMANGQPVDIDGGVYVVMLDIATGIQPLDPARNIRVFPNPTDDAFLVDFGNTQVESIELYDALGQRIFGQQVDSQQVQINVRDFAPGLYLVRMNTEEGQVLYKKVIVR